MMDCKHCIASIFLYVGPRVPKGGSGIGGISSLPHYVLQFSNNKSIYLLHTTIINLAVQVKK